MKMNHERLRTLDAIRIAERNDYLNETAGPIPIYDDTPTQRKRWKQVALMTEQAKSICVYPGPAKKA